MRILIMKKNQNVKTIYVDLDGTFVGKNGSLIHNHLGELSSASLDGLKKAQENNCEIIITTGRDKFRTADFARVLGLTQYIAEAGCVIKTTEAETFNFGIANKYYDFENNSSEQFHEEVVKAGTFLVEKFSGSIQEHSEYNRGQYGTTMLRGNIDEVNANELLQENWPYLEIYGNGHGMFRRSMPGVENVLIYHLAPIGTTKVGGIKYDKELRNLSTENCFMIGDGFADLLCSTEVNKVFVPINGVNADKNSALYAQEHENVEVLKGSHNEGFQEAIEKIIKIDQ